MLRFEILASILVLALAAPSLALTIDSFEDGDFTLTSLYGDPQQLAEQSGLTSTPDGVRMVTAQTDGAGPVGTSAAALATAPLTDDGVVLTTVGVGAISDFQFIYDGIANGINDTINGALRLDLVPYHSILIESTGVADGVTAQVTLWNQTTSAFGFTLPFTVGQMLLPLDGFGAFDLSKVRSIRIRINDIELGTSGDALTITNIMAIPEPGTALLVAGGLLALAGARRRG